MRNSSGPLTKGGSCRVFTLSTQQRPCGSHVPLRRAQDLHCSGKSGSPKAGFDIPLSYPWFLSPILGSLRVSEPRAELLGTGERVAGTSPWVLLPDSLSICLHHTFIHGSHNYTALSLCHSSRAEAMPLTVPTMATPHAVNSPFLFLVGPRPQSQPPHSP